MSDHSKALVLLEAWPFSSPDVADQGRSVDIGLLAEALIYYDQVLFNVGNQNQFAELLSWFISRNLFAEFTTLLQEGSLKVYDYGFFIAPFVQDNHYVLYSIQDEASKRLNSFTERYLDSDTVRRCFPRRSLKEKLHSALAENIIEAKVDEFGNFIIEAQNDFIKPQRNILIVQALVDELYKVKSLGPAPKLEISVTPDSDSFHKVTWNIDFNQLTERIGKKLAVHPGSPLIAAGIANRTLLSASHLECDLYLSRPMSRVVGDKLYETSRSTVKTKEVIENLQVEVAFPDLRKLINQDKINFKEVLKIRRKAKKFRTWLQSESERDRNALLAYHHEVAKESGFVKNSRKLLELFGAITGVAAPTLIKAFLEKNPEIDLVTSGLFGAAVGRASSYILELVAKREKDWKPIVFGGWYEDRIAKLMEEVSQNDSSETFPKKILS